MSDRWIETTSGSASDVTHVNLQETRAALLDVVAPFAIREPPCWLLIMTSTFPVGRGHNVACLLGGERRTERLVEPHMIRILVHRTPRPSRKHLAVWKIIFNRNMLK
jgi:hypothetical protein